MEHDPSSSSLRRAEASLEGSRWIAHPSGAASPQCKDRLYYRRRGFLWSDLAHTPVDRWTGVVTPDVVRRDEEAVAHVAKCMQRERVQDGAEAYLIRLRVHKERERFKAAVRGPQGRGRRGGKCPLASPMPLSGPLPLDRRLAHHGSASGAPSVAPISWSGSTSTPHRRCCSLRGRPRPLPAPLRAQQPSWTPPRRRATGKGPSARGTPAPRRSTQRRGRGKQTPSPRPQAARPAGEASEAPRHTAAPPMPCRLAPSGRQGTRYACRGSAPTGPNAPPPTHGAAATGSATQARQRGGARRPSTACPGPSMRTRSPQSALPSRPRCEGSRAHRAASVPPRALASGRCWSDRRRQA